LEPHQSELALKPELLQCLELHPREQRQVELGVCGRVRRDRAAAVGDPRQSQAEPQFLAERSRHSLSNRTRLRVRFHGLV